MTRYIGKQPAFGNFVKLDAISVVNGQAAYTMQSGSSNFTNYDNVNQFIVSLNGVIQAPTDSFTVSGSTITFASALSTGDVINFILVLGDVLSVGTPSDNTVSTAKIQNTAVNADKLATDSVIEAKIQNDAVTRDKINAISTSSLPSFEAKGTAGQSDGYIQLNCEQNSHGIKLKSPPHSAGQSYTLTFPSTAPATDKMLQTNSSGVLSFVDAPSGGYQLISRTAVSAGSYVDFNQILDGTYSTIHCVIEGVQPDGSSSSNFYFQVQTTSESSGSFNSSGIYYYSVVRHSDGNGIINTGQQYGRLTRDGGGTSSGERGFAGTLHFYQTDSTTRHKFFDFRGSTHQQDGSRYGMSAGGNVETTDRLTGFRFYWSSGSFLAKGHISIYGLVKS